MPDSVELLDVAKGYEAAGSLDRALSAYERSRQSTKDPAIIAEALRHEADIHRTRCDWDQALTAARASATAAEAAGLPDQLAEAVNAEAAVHHTRGDFTRASSLYRRILDMPVHDRVRGIAFQNLALVSVQANQDREAEPFFRKSIGCFRRAGYVRGEVIALINLGRYRLERSEPDAVEALADAERRALHLGDLDLLAMARLNYAEALLLSGDEEHAEDIACIAMGHFDVTDNAFRRIECLRILGDIQRRRGENESARRFYERALGIADRIDASAETGQLKARLESL
jgi:tetratricopeptide (TPR) repeat protein